jgi:glycosyltransferase involved in cell wall biosynthesis
MVNNNDSKLNIHHLVGRLIYGGLERQVSYYKEFSKNRNINHHIFTIQPRLQIETKLFDTEVKGGLLKLFKLTTNNDKIFLHCHTTKALLIGLFLKLFKPRINVSFHVHTYKILEYKWLKYFFKYCHIIICVNSNLTFEINKLFKPKKILTIPNGIVLEETTKINNSKFNVLGYVGRLEPEKNILELPSFFNEIKKRNTNINELLVFGDGSQYSELKQRLHISKINFCINRNVKNINQIYSSIGALVLTSKIESFSLSTIEALQFGLKVYTCDKISYNLFKEIYPETIILLEENDKNLQIVPHLNPIKCLNDLDINKVTRMLELTLTGLE